MGGGLISFFLGGGGGVARCLGVISEKSPDFRSQEVGISGIVFGTFIGCISGYWFYTISDSTERYHVNDSLSISPDRFSSAIINDRLLID